MNLHQLLAYRWSYLIRLAGISLLYAVSVKLSLAYLTSDGNISIVWIPSGIGLAVLLIGGRKYWPAIFMGALAAYVLWVGRPWLPSTFIAISNVLEPLLGYWLLTHLRIKNTSFDIAFTHSYDYLWLALTAGFIALVAALIGVVTLWLAGIVMPAMMPASLLHWWMGNTLGIFTITPLILVWRTAPAHWLNRQHLLETMACFGLSFLFGQIIFLGWFSQVLGAFAHSYWMFLFVTWSSIRFGRHGSLLIIGMVILQALLGATHGVGYFGRDGTHDWEMLWLYAMLLTGIGVTMTLVMHERKQAESKINRLTKLYAALSQCNQAIVRCNSEAELFPKICHDAVTFGGVKMVWIGLFDEKNQWLKPVASYGVGVEYLDLLKLSVDANEPSGRGPSGMAFREDQAFWCLDFTNDSTTEIWHELGLKFDWIASAALPLHRDGKVVGTFNIYADSANVFDEAGRNLLVEMATDIDFAMDHFNVELERVKFKEKLLESEEISRLVLENSIDAIINMDSEGLVIEWSGAAFNMFGYTREDALGRTLSDLIIPRRDREAHFKGMQRVLTSNKSNMTGRRVEVNALRIDGSEFSVEMSVAQIKRGDLVFFSAFIRDITERKQSESQILHLAHFDALTGLPNRTMLQDHFKYALSLVKRNNGKLAVMFLDLDHFKDINDTLGHSIGDELLIEMAKRLQSMLREEDTLSRLGGDEFIVILPGTDARGAANVSQKLLSILAEPYRIEPYELTVTGSIGLALYPNDGTDLEALSQKADTAMYRAKQEGRNDYRFFTAEMQATSARNLQLVTALRHALERKQLSLHYQPQLSMHDNRIIGAEALLRWQHPELGSISPAEFIPIAEDSGLILPIGEWVLRQAAQQAKAWMADGHGSLIMAVNLSAIQFRHPDLTDLVTRILNKVGLAPEYLELELTEGVAMHDPQGAIAVMNNLHELGIRMSIDDFGTGYSSLSYLKKFKIYKLKIDQSFVRDISTDPEDKAIVSAIISMARSLGLQTIAEGVETIEQLAYLREQGCDEMQGYYYSKPIPAEQFEKLLKGNSLGLG